MYSISIEQSLARSREHFVDFVEAVVAAVVGVGDIGGFFGGDGGVEGSHQADFVLRRALVDEFAVVRCVHRDDPVKDFGVTIGVELAGAEVGEVDIVFGGDKD